MNNPDTEIIRKGIVVIQSLAEKDRKTGDELYNDVLRYKEWLEEDSFVTFYNVTSLKEFIDVLVSLSDEMIDGEIFTLHLETHGSEKGIQLSSGECMSWDIFFDNVRPININMGNLLVIVMAMCKGAAIISHIEPEKRAPYKAFVGANRDLNEEEVYIAFNAFYGNYTNMLDIVNGMNALDLEIDGVNPSKKTFWCYSAEHIFDLTFNPDRAPIHFNEMVTKQFNRITSEGINITRDQVKQDIRKMLIDSSVKYKDYFCFKDIFGEN